MKITGSRSYINVEFTEGTFAGKKIRIEGELTLSPAFYADKNSIKHWEPPYERVIISNVDKQEIVKQVLEQKYPRFEIFFEE
jgi:Immunity protein 74